MMELVEKNRIKAVVCYRLDRISRSVADFSVMYQKFEDKNVDFFSTSEHYDTSTPSGKAMLSMCVVFAQMERETIAERIRDNMHELAKTGRWLGGNTPTGYRSIQTVGSVTIDGKTRKAYQLEKIKDEAAIVNKIYNAFLESASLVKTESFCSQNKIKTKTGKAFTRFSLRAILTNPVYMKADSDAWQYFHENKIEIFAQENQFDGRHGVIAYNKTLQKPGRTNQLRNIDEWIIAVGKHEGIISGADWIRVQEKLLQNKAKNYRKPKNQTALLAGILYCGHCGENMRPKKSSKTDTYRYLCRTKEKSRCQNCKNNNPDGNALDNLVCEEIKKLPENQAEYRKKIKSILLQTEENEKALQDNIAENERTIETLVEALTSCRNQPASHYITEKIDALHQNNERLKQQLENLRLQATQNPKKTELMDFSAAFGQMDTEQKRTAIRSLVEKVIWDGETAHLIFSGAANPFSCQPEPKHNHDNY